MNITDAMYEFLRHDPGARDILRLHYDKGMPPSEIDRKLELRPGNAHDTICDYWAFDKAYRGKQRRNSTNV